MEYAHYKKELLISARDTFNESAIDERYYVNIENTPVSAVPDEAEKFAGAIKVTYSVSIVDILDDTATREWSWRRRIPHSGGAH